MYEAAVFKTLGAKSSAIARMLLFEYGVLGLLAGTVGSAGAVALTWGVSRFALDIPWKVFPAEHLAGVDSFVNQHHPYLFNRDKSGPS